MKAFLLLLDARGKVVTRQQLFDVCWGGAIVGDDSLNRAIGRVRRIATQTGPGLFEVSAIPRTGYQLTGTVLDQAASEDKPPTAQTISRRQILASSALLGVATLATGVISFQRDLKNDRFETLVEQGRRALDYGHPSIDPIAPLSEAVKLRSGDATALGLLALAAAYGAENGNPDQAANNVALSQASATRALALNLNEPNALTALVALQRSMLDLIATEDRLRAILSRDPDNIYTMRFLWGLLQSTGRSRDAYAMIQRASSFAPSAAANNYPRAQLLWILGHTAEADRVIDQAIQFWPDHPFVRFARFTIFAYTGRPQAALTMLDDDHLRPQGFSPAAVDLWRVTLAALRDPSPTNTSAAKIANLTRASADPRLAYQAMMALSALNEVDAAFTVANEFLLFVKPVVQTISKIPTVKSTSWRFTPGLFTPPVAAMRADPRFKLLCEGIGLSAYWHRRGIRPDYQLGNSNAG